MIMFLRVKSERISGFYLLQNIIALKGSENLEKPLNTAYHCIHKVRFKAYHAKRKAEVNPIQNQQGHFWT